MKLNCENRKSWYRAYKEHLTEIPLYHSEVQKIKTFLTLSLGIPVLWEENVYVWENKGIKLIGEMNPKVVAGGSTSPEIFKKIWHILGIKD